MACRMIMDERWRFSRCVAVRIAAARLLAAVPSL